MIRVMITDDEPLARESLVQLLTKDPEFQVAGLAKNGADALELVKKIKPDVIFLDIEMPIKNGLDTASDLLKLSHPPLIVFATAFNQYAVEAFESNAIDYILKPLDATRVKKTLQKIKERVSSHASQKKQMESLEDALIQKGILKKIAAYKRHSKDRTILDPGDVDYFYVHLGSTLAAVGTEEFEIKAVLKDLLAQLNPEQFLQTHKAYLVNLQKIAKVAPMFSGNFEIILKAPSHAKIPLSRRYANGIKKHLGNW